MTKDDTFFPFFSERQKSKIPSPNHRSRMGRLKVPCGILGVATVERDKRVRPGDERRHEGEKGT